MFEHPLLAAKKDDFVGSWRLSDIDIYQDDNSGARLLESIIAFRKLQDSNSAPVEGFDMPIHKTARGVIDLGRIVDLRAVPVDDSASDFHLMVKHVKNN